MSSSLDLSPSGVGSVSLLDPLDPVSAFDDEEEASSAAAASKTRLTEEEAALGLEAAKAFKEGRLQEALRALEKVGESRPGDFLAAMNLIVTKYEIGELDVGKAMRELEDIFNDANTGGDFEDGEKLGLVYNLSLAYFLRRQFVKSGNLLKRHLPAVSTNPNLCPSNPDLPKRFLSLAVSVVLSLNESALAARLLNDLEKMSATSASAESKPTNVTNLLNRARILLQSKQHKTFKRDLKPPTSMTVDESVTFDFLRANMEYVKGNHKKAQKLLSVPTLNGKRECPSTFHESLFDNNTGCVHMMLNKPHLAAYYFAQARSKHTKAINADDAERKRKDFYLRVHHVEMAYNLGVALLHCGSYKQAFETFLQARLAFRENPHLWLHLAECVIAANTDETETFKYLQISDGNKNKSSEIDVNLKQVGRGRQKKIVAHGKEADNVSAAVSLSQPTMTLSFAAAALRNANHLVSLRAQRSQPPSDHLPITTKLTLLRAAILTKQAYVALRLDNHTEALRHSQELLQLSSDGVPGGFFTLGRLYAGESLVLLDRIAEAKTFLEPKSVLDVSMETGATSAKEDTDRRSSGPITAENLGELVATRSMFTYNLAVAHLMRGETERSETMLEQLWKGRSGHRIAEKVLMARMYVMLKRDKIKECRELIKMSFSMEK